MRAGPPLFAALVAVSAACDRPPSDSDAREWTPADHDHIEDQQRAAQGGQPGTGGGGQAAQSAQVIESIWRSQCAACHGAVGKGDGPTGPMLHATDLTSEEWQAKTTDSQIATTIKNGKGKMPKFDIPDPLVRGLVDRIRFFRGK